MLGCALILTLSLITSYDCAYDTLVNITNCDQFYVYQLPTTPICYDRYCSYDPNELEKETPKENLV